MERGVHEGNDFEVVERGRAFEPNMTSNIAASEKAVLGIGNASALKEAEADMARREDDGENGVGRALVGNETDHEGVVIVVDHLDRAGEALAYFREGAAGE